MSILILVTNDDGFDSAGLRRLETALRKLMKSEADLVGITLEDLWHETKRQNVPGTTDEHPNWRRPLRYGLEDIEAKLGTILSPIGKTQR